MGGLAQSGLGTVEDRHARALGGERDGGGAADAAGSAGDEGDLPVKRRTSRSLG